MITIKPLLSENVKDFMDYALEVIKSMDGAPEHSITEQDLVREKIARLRTYLDKVLISYEETIPRAVSTEENPSTFSGTGHS